MQQQPKVFIEVVRPADLMAGTDFEVARVEVSADLLFNAKHPCALLTVALRNALAELGYKL